MDTSPSPALARSSAVRPSPPGRPGLRRDEERRPHQQQPDADPEPDERTHQLSSCPLRIRCTSMPAALELLEPRRQPAGAPQLGAVAHEDRLGLDDVVLDAAGDPHDLVDAAYAVLVDAEVQHEVDAGGDGGHHEPRRDVLAREQRQGAALHQRLAGAVGVDRAHPGQPGVEGEQQVEALLRAHLAHDHPATGASAATPSPGRGAGPRRCPRAPAAWSGARPSRGG